MMNRNEKWHILTVNAVEKKLHTNASLGLSRKEARSRYRKYGENTAFKVNRTRFQSNLQSMLCDPAILLYLFICVLCFFFFETAVAVVSLIFFAFCAVLIGKMLHLEREVELGIEKRRTPTVRVIRDGMEFVIGAKMLVVGDLVVFKKGDIVPSDCRLIFSDRLRVQTLCADDAGRLHRRSYPKSAKEAGLDETFDTPYEWENILFCGSEILEGEARAIVFASGGDNQIFCDAHLQQMPDEFNKKNKARDVTSILSPYIRVYSALLFALFVLLSVFAFFTKSNSSVLCSILSIASFIAIGAQSILLLYARMPTNTVKARFFFAEELQQRVIFQSEQAVAGLASVTDVVLLGRGALSDGLLHLKGYALGDGTPHMLLGRESAVDLEPLCEAMLLEKSAHLGQAIEGKDAFKTLRRELCALCSFDQEALKTRLVSLAALRREDALILDVSVKGGEYRLYISEDSSWIDRCIFFEKNRRTSVLSSQGKAKLLSFARDNHAKGLGTRIIVKKVGTQLILLGALAFGEILLKDAGSVVSDLRQNGVRSTILFDGSREEALLYVERLGLDLTLIDASDMDAEALSAKIGADAALYGASLTELNAAIRLLEKKKRKIAVLGSAPEDRDVMRAASLSVGCDTCFLDESVSADQREELLEAGAAVSVRRYSDIMVFRPNESGGGLLALSYAILESRACQRRTLSLISLLVSSHFIRASVLILSTILLLGQLPSFQLLYLGLLFEAAAAMLFSNLSIRDKALSMPFTVTEKRIESILLKPRRWLPYICSSACLVLLGLVLYILNFMTAENFCVACFCGSYLMQIIAASAAVCNHMTESSVKRTMAMVGIFAIPILIMIAFSVALPAINSFLLLGNWSLSTGILILITPVFYRIFLSLFSSFFSRTAK